MISEIEPTMLIMQILLSLVGFFSVFILTAIWQGQRELSRQVQKALTQVACHEQVIHMHAKQIDEKCSLAECPLKNDSVVRHVIVRKGSN